MAQVLSLEIKAGETLLATGYYHLSGFSRLAAEKVSEALGVYSPAAKDLRRVAISMLENTGAGVTDEERVRIKTDEDLNLRKYSDIQGESSRDLGFIDITKQGMEETQHYAEFTAVLDLKSETVNFGVYWESRKDYFVEEELTNGEYPDRDAIRKACDTFPKLPDIDFKNIPFSEFWKVNDLIEGADYYMDDDFVYGWID